MMFRKLIRNICIPYYFPVLSHTRHHIAALYLTGDKAKENFAVLTPYMDFPNDLTETALRERISWRNTNFDFKEIIRKYEVFENTKLEILRLESRRQAIVKDLKESAQSEDDINALKKEGRALRDQLKLLKKEFYAIEDDFIKKFLELPNYLHEKTPQEYTKLLYRKEHPEIFDDQMKTCTNHLERKDLIHFTSETSSYYLLNEAAHFDWEFPYNCVKYFLSKNFIQTVNPDFCRSVLVEAALIDKSTLHEVIEEVDQFKINALHLIGGGDLLGFLGYVTKLSLFSSALPLRFITTGRKYNQIRDKDNALTGLYTTTQSNVIQTFIACETREQADIELEAVLNLVVDIYKQLDVNFLIEFLPARQLLMAESLRASIRIYSPVYERYIEVGHVSHYTDFISKRLLFNIRKQKGYCFPSIVGGAIADATKIIACLLENDKQLKAPRYENSKDFIC